MRERATANDVPFTPLDKLFEPTVPQGPELPAVDTLPVQELQKAVGGSIEVVPAELGDDALVICNEEGKIMGLPYNRCVYDADGIPYDVIAGTFILCDENRDGEFVSITPEHEAKYMERYSREMILSHAEPPRDAAER